MVLNIQAAASRRLTDLHLLWFQSHRRWTIFPLLLSQIYLHLIHSLVHHKKRRNLPPLFFLLWFWLLFFFLGYIIIAASASSASSEAIGPTRCPGCPLDYGHSLTPPPIFGDHPLDRPPTPPTPPTPIFTAYANQVDWDEKTIARFTVR